MAVKKKQRFEVFRRDNFTCQYCGRQTPIVVLEVDHLISKADGGFDEIDNLITSCRDCNRGKGASSITMTEIKEGQNEALKVAKEKESQRKEFERFMKKQRDDENNSIENLCSYWADLNENKYSLNSRGRASIKQFLRKLTSFELTDAMDIASSKISSDSKEEIERRFRYFCGICHNWIKAKQAMEDDDEKE